MYAGEMHTVARSFGRGVCGWRDTESDQMLAI